MGDDPALFDADPAWQTPDAEPAEKLSAGRRLTLRQAADLDAGRHPLTRGRLHPDAAPPEPRTAEGRRCGNCRFRTARAWGDVANTYPKCTFGKTDRGYPRATRGPATDCRAWWSGCADHEYEQDGQA